MLNRNDIRCRVTFIAQLDLKGALPSMITRTIGIRQPLSVHGTPPPLMPLE